MSEKEKTVNVKIQHLYKTDEELNSTNPILLNGEICYVKDSDQGKYKIGDGTTTYSDLPFEDSLYWKQNGSGSFANDNVKIAENGNFEIKELISVKDNEIMLSNSDNNIILNNNGINSKSNVWTLTNKNKSEDSLTIEAQSEKSLTGYFDLNYKFDMGSVKNSFNIIHIDTASTAPTINMNSTSLNLYGFTATDEKNPIINFYANTFNKENVTSKIEETASGKLTVNDNLEVTSSAVNVKQGSLSAANISSSYADYAKYFEWLDENPDNIDRVGRFVTLDGDKIKYAVDGDDFILGIVSSCPSFVDNAAELEWQGKYLKDIYGRDILDKETGKRILNPDYDETKEYIPRSKRKEYSPIALKGKVVVIDDGTCIPNSYAKPAYNGGIATYCSINNGYRVLKRLDENHVEVLIC